MKLRNSLLLVAVLLLISGCANQVKRQAFNKDVHQQVKKIAIAETSDEESYNAWVMAHPGVNFGLIGGLIAAADMQAKSKRVSAAIDPQKTQLRHHFVTDLSASLNRQGYETEIVQLDKGLDEQRAMAALKEKTHSDAVILANIHGQYIAAAPTTPYAPHVSVKVRAEAAQNGQVLYEDTISWGYAFGGNTQVVHLPGGDSYRFEDVSAIEKASDQAREAFLEGANAISTQIADDLRKN